MNERIRPDLNRLSDQHIGEHRVRALALSGLRDLLRDYGVDYRPIFEEAGLPPDQGDELAWISLGKLIGALTLAARVTGDRYFGLKHGTRGRFTANPLGYLMANSPDLRTGLRNFAHFQPVLSTNHLEFVETAGGTGRIEFSYPVTIPNAVQMTDFVLMRFVSRIRAVAGSQWRPVSVGLMHRRPADISEYERQLGPRISFDQPVNSITISTATLALPMPNADPQLFKLVKRYCEEEVERQKSANHPLNGIREAMTRCLQQGGFGPKHVAVELGLTPSSLHRRLKAEGTSFLRLLDDTRRCLAHRYLMESSLKLTDIAARVGYSELSAFSRAARRWFGTSPRSFRRKAPNLNEAA
jgi:AraC-like DNA-binding protein